MAHFLPHKDAEKRVHGRGTADNPTPRFLKEDREAFFDDWQNEIELEDAIKTTVTLEHPKTIINRNQSPDLPFDRSINPYRGCEHGCIYCFARPTHAYLDLSPGVDFESKLFAKPDAAELLRYELSKPSYKCEPIAFGTNTDPYQPIEREHKIMRSLIEVLAETKHPFTITTKSDLVLRDLDLLEPLAKQNLVRVCISVTSLSSKLSRIMEPRASAPHRRLLAIEKLTNAGVKVIVQVAPIIPAINDTEIEQILETAKSYGAIQAVFIPIRLPHEVSDLFRGWLDRHFPDRASKVMSQIQDMRGGKDNDPNFGSRMNGRGPYANMLSKRFRRACDKLKFEGRKYDIATDLFIPPKRKTDQLSLF